MRIMYTGSFDPITNGHIDIIRRMSRIFNNDEIYIVLATNRDKKHMYSNEERFEMLKLAVSDLNVNVVIYEGVISNYINENNIDILVRGIRNSTDLDYENQIEQFTCKTTNVETIYLTPMTIHQNTSSSLVRNFIKFKKVDSIKEFVHPSTFEFINSGI